MIMENGPAVTSVKVLAAGVARAVVEEITGAEGITGAEEAATAGMVAAGTSRRGISSYTDQTGSHEFINTYLMLTNVRFFYLRLP